MDDKNLKIPFGLNLKDSRMYSVEDVPNGKACGCVCPKCGDELEARNRGKTHRVHHFAHGKKNDCVGAGETAIHKMAKQIVFESSYLYVPTFEYQPVGLLVNQEKCWGDKVVILGRDLTINSAIEEERQKDYGFTPDILVDIGGKYLAVEVFYTNPVSEQKKIKVKNSKMAMIQIDLSGVDYETLVNAELFKKLVLDDKDNRIWIYNPKGEQLVIKANNDLAQKIKIENELRLIRKAKERKLKEERDQKKRLDDERVELARLKNRKIIANEIEQLLKYNESSWRMQREKILLDKALNAHPKILEIYHTQKSKSLHENLINIIDPKDWIFKVHRILWQSHILLYFFTRNRLYLYCFEC